MHVSNACFIRSGNATSQSSSNGHQVTKDITLGPADMTGHVLTVQNSSKVPNRTLIAL